MYTFANLGLFFNPYGVNYNTTTVQAILFEVDWVRKQIISDLALANHLRVCPSTKKYRPCIWQSEALLNE